MVAQLDADLVVLQDVRDVVKIAKAAQQEFEQFSQEQVDKVVRAMAEAAEREAESLARLAVQETKYGVLEHKIIKNRFAARDVYNSIKDIRTVGIVHEDKSKQIIEVASPFGVVAAIIPSTNPTSTAIFKCLISVKARNAIVLSPHPSASECTVLAAKVCADAAYAAGAPKGLISWLEKPTLPATEALMHHRDVNVILATGGGGLVRAAYSSGKPAYGVGPGNVPAYIDRSADVDHAVRNVVESKTFDNGTICASEQALVVDEAIKTQVLEALRHYGAYLLTEKEKEAVGKVMFPQRGKLNSGIVGRSASYIAGLAGVFVPSGTIALVGEETRFGKDAPFSLEKLSPVLALYTANDWKHASEICGKLLDVGGRGHTLSLHAKDESVIRDFLLKQPVSRILVNTSASLGAIGATTELVPSMTLGCGSFGGNITSDNITVDHLMNKKRLAYASKEISIGERKEAKPTPGYAKDEIVNAVVEEIRPLSSRFSKEQISLVVTEVIQRLSTTR